MKTLLSATIVVLFLLSAVAAHASEDSRKIATEELLLVMKVDKMSKPLMNQVQQMIEQQIVQAGDSEKIRPIVKKYFDRFFTLMQETLGWNVLKDDYITIYANTFTEDELKSMLAFYKSPVGQSVIEKIPKVTEQAMGIMQKRLPDFQEKMKVISDEMSQEIKAQEEKTKREKSKSEEAPGT